MKSTALILKISQSYDFGKLKIKIGVLSVDGKCPENTVWSAKIKRSGFLPEPESVSLSGCRMQKIAALNFCAPKLSIY
ncbi:hypothetical protein QUF75_04345 [Desulfococcaceae bacterium HSG7]|nr:hypothetical protein [Desulfococcaceae bacterium HSG9]MDM8553942.1 hypothetical protein [Desulfococcaceae bacterium HSG7]